MANQDLVQLHSVHKQTVSCSIGQSFVILVSIPIALVTEKMNHEAQASKPVSFSQNTRENGWATVSKIKPRKGKKKNHPTSKLHTKSTKPIQQTTSSVQTSFEAIPDILKPDNYARHSNHKGHNLIFIIPLVKQDHYLGLLS